MSDKNTQQQTHRFSRKWRIPLLEEQWRWAEVFTPEETVRGATSTCTTSKKRSQPMASQWLIQALLVAARADRRKALMVWSAGSLLQDKHPTGILFDAARRPPLIILNQHSSV